MALNNHLTKKIKNMKKTVLLLTTLFAVSVLFSSCKKNYTCKCTNTTSGFSSTNVFPNMKKNDAKNLCEANTGGTTICELL